MPIQRALEALILSGVFDRFPRLKLVSVESGIGWVPHFLERLDEKTTGEAPLQSESALQGDMLPREYFHRNVLLTFVRDQHGIRSRDIIGPENILWSSDFPHPSSTWPRSREALRQQMKDMPAEERYKIVAGNAIRLYRFGQ